MPVFERHIARILRARLHEPRRFMQVVQGPRQVGTTTAVRQVLASLRIPSIYVSADMPEAQGRRWLTEAWDEARSIHDQTGGPVVLALDEAQKLPKWTSWVKYLWDQDAWDKRDIRVVLLGSSPLLIGRGLSESMAGRFEIIRASHWTWPECRDAFGWDLETFIFFGGYPGAATLVGDEARWREYVKETAIETSVSRDLLHMTRIDKPAVLRRLIYLAAEYSGRELSFRKILGQLDDVGNATTVAHYLDLLEGVGLASGLQKYAGEPFRSRASTPKLMVHNTALMSVMSGRSFAEARADGAWWGRLVESCVGAHLLAQQRRWPGDAVFYWRDRSDEVDFVLRSGSRLIAVEVKSGAHAGSKRGLEAFDRRFGGDVTPLVVGTGGLSMQEFLESVIVPLD
ncbi:MAG: ATP-binding protein [Coriobacteriales bacterium]|nr:ATP-binding protein [Coriobacteriales bacterium]